MQNLGSMLIIMFFCLLVGFATLLRGDELKEIKNMFTRFINIWRK